jgi:hypothetical protein
MPHDLPLDADELSRRALEFCALQGSHPMADTLRRAALDVSLRRELDKVPQLRLLLEQASLVACR